MERSILHDVGLTEKEIDVYLALFRLGQITTTGIIKESKVHASKVYPILDRLIDKGLVSSVKKEGKNYYQAADPEMIKVYLEKKQNTIIGQLKDVEKLIPELRLLKDESAEDEEVDVFFGWKGLETAFRDILRELKKGDTQCVIGGTYIEEIPIHNRIFENLRKERDKLGIKTKIIFSEVARAKFPAYEQSSLTEIRYIKQNIPTSIDIYGSKVIISMMKKRPIVIQIKSQEIADSFVEYFKMMWLVAKA